MNKMAGGSLGNKPCCSAAAARGIKQIIVDGNSIGVFHLDEAIDEVMSMGLQTDAEVQEALFKKVEIFNYIPYSRQQIYGRALLDEYKRRC